MKQWLHLRRRYLHILLEVEGRPISHTCSMCSGHAVVKCPDCIGATSMCKACCLQAHRNYPFHRPLLWTATHYTQASLHSLGFALCLEHNGAPCPKTVEVWKHPIHECSLVIYIHIGNQGSTSSQPQQEESCWEQTCLPCFPTICAGGYRISGEC